MGQRIPESIKKDFKLEEIFSAQIKQSLGLWLFVKDWEKDLKQASDFVLVAERSAVGCRIRREEYFKKYGNEFTIRWARPSGVATEIHKIENGYMTHFFYGFCNKVETELIFYRLLDMNIFRRVDPEPIAIKNNIDSSSKLAAFLYSHLPPSFIIHSWPDEIKPESDDRFWIDGFEQENNE